jgi:hypothetical protein
MLAGLLPLLSLVAADTPLTNRIRPTEVCSQFNEDDTSVKWYPALRLSQTYNQPEGALFELSPNLNKVDWQFDAGSLASVKGGQVGWDFIRVFGGGPTKGQFKFSFMNKDDLLLASMWATAGANCRLPHKLNRNDVDHVTISMRKF